MYSTILRKGLLASVVAAWLGGAVFMAFAQDQKEADKAAQPAAPFETRIEGKEENSEPPPDEKLIKSLESREAAVESEIRRIERIIEGMRSAGKRIGESNTGKQTQEIQEQVVRELEELLKKLKQQQQNQKQQSSSSQKNRKQDQQDRQKLPNQPNDPQNSGKNQPMPDPQDGQSSKRRKDNQPQDSQENVDPSKSAEAEKARRSQMVKDVWGHLPPNVRAAMENAFSEKYLPKYEELVKRYYEALAEKNKKRPR